MTVPQRTAPDRRRRDLQVLAEIAGLSMRDQDLREILRLSAVMLRDACGLVGVGFLVRHGERYDLEVVAGPEEAWRSRRYRTLSVAQALIDSTRSVHAQAAEGGQLNDASLVAASVPISTGEGEPWGLLAAVGDERSPIRSADVQLLVAAAAQLGVAVSRSQLLGGLVRQLRTSEALRTIAADIGSKLDLGQILSGLVDYALVLFGGDRAAVFLLQPDGTLRGDVVRNLSPGYLTAVRHLPSPSIGSEAMARRRPVYATDYAHDPRSGPIRDLIIREGYDSVCMAPLYDAGGVLGLLGIYHDDRHEWSDQDLSTLDALATQGSVAIRTAQNFAQMATWAAQLQSIQHLGARLSRLTTVQDIGAAIASELRQLIEYHNVRVYRATDDRRLVPVASHGTTFEYVGETLEQLGVQWGEGITGWVAEHRMAQNLPDAAHDARTMVIPGTSEDVDESMLVAPMIFEGRVLGVLVLSKLGLRQFTDDDLRLLVIYASFAGQAMANAEATERLRAQTAQLERQLRSQRELLHITESILTSLDARVIVEQITDRLLEIVRYDVATVELGDPSAPITVAGRAVRESPGADGPDAPAPEPNVLGVPLRGRDEMTGMLRLVRYGDQPRFTPQEVELVRLFAAHVSIALQNAEVHQEVELRARTDDLTGLLNQGTLVEWLRREVEGGDTFSLIMLDLDDFKVVNDRMGHQAGDVFLRQIAAAVVGAARESDIVFRYGGDEFVVLLPRTDSPGGRQMAERVREALHGVRVGRRSRDPRGRDAGIEVSASIGVATFPEDGASPDEVLLAADRACYVAKRAGRDRIADAEEGRALAEEFTLQAPTPVDAPTPVETREPVAGAGFARREGRPRL